MNYIVYRLLRLFSGVRYAIRRRYTPAGRFVLTCLAVTAAVGVDTDLSAIHEGFTFSFALLAVGFVAALGFRPRFEVERTLPAFVTAGEPFRYRARVRCAGGRPLTGAVLIEEFADPRPSYKRFAASRALGRASVAACWRALVGPRRPPEIDHVVLPVLAPERANEVTVEARAVRRGEIRFTAASLARVDPLGLVRATARRRAPGSVLVLPKRYTLPTVAIPGNRVYQHGGVTLAASKGDSEEFVGLRDYREGDPLQRVHWKSFARTGRPVVKEYQDEFFERHALVLDTFAARADDAFEEAVAVAASFACTLESQENLLDLMFVGDRAYTFTAGVGQLHTESMLAILAGVEPRPDRPFRELHDAVLARRAALSGCILVLLALDEMRRALVDDLSATGLPMRVLVVAEGELGEMPAGVHLLRPGAVQEGLATL